MYRIIANPHGCCDKKLRGDKSCVECYYSQVNSRNQWTGSQECFDAPCLKAWPYKTEGYEADFYNGMNYDEFIDWAHANC